MRRRLRVASKAWLCSGFVAGRCAAPKLAATPTLRKVAEQAAPGAGFHVALSQAATGAVLPCRRTGEFDSSTNYQVCFLCVSVAHALDPRASILESTIWCKPASSLHSALHRFLEDCTSEGLAALVPLVHKALQQAHASPLQLVPFKSKAERHSDLSSGCSNRRRSLGTRQGRAHQARRFRKFPMAFVL